MSTFKASWIYDLEVFPNMFYCGVKDFKTKEYHTWEVSDRRDDRESLYQTFSTYDGYLMAFNSLHYDDVVMKYIIKEWSRLKSLSVKEFLKKIKTFSDAIIKDDHDTIKWYKWFKGINWTSIDLFSYWSKMLRLSKKLSLKSLAIQINWGHIQELPYDPETILTHSQMDDIIRYNLDNDLGIVEHLALKMKPEILLRKFITDEFNLNAWSLDAPKIAGELLIMSYVDQTFEKKYPDVSEEDMEHEVLYRDHSRAFRQTKHSPYYGKIKDVMGDFKVDFILPEFQALQERMFESTREFKDEFSLVHEGSKTAMKMSYGIGGFHNLMENKIYRSNEEEVIMTSDYASLYPNIIINWECIRYAEVMQKYKDVKEERLIAKKNKEKNKDALYKLILNSLSGLLDNSHHPLYYPEGALRMRIIGQLIMSKTMEIAILNGWQVISGNTDGMEVLVPRKDLEKYTEVMKEAEQLFNIALEHSQYDFIVYSNVNNYLAKTTEGKIKKKGFFKHHEDIPLGDSVNEQVIAVALEKYFIENIPIEETIKQPWKHGLHVYDYTLSKKISKDYVVWHNNEKQQQLNRYYFAKSAPYLFKQKKTKKTMEHVHKGHPVIIFNRFEEKDWEAYNIDYSVYCKKTRDIIDELQKDIRQISLF